MTREELCIHACKYAIGELTRKGSCLFITSEHEGREQISWVAVVEWLNALEQEPKTGHWIINEDEENTVHGHCSVCGWEAHYYEDDIIGMPYCPNCGAKMEVEE